MLRIVIGRAGVGKTYRCLTEISRELRKDPSGPPLLLVVPEESTFAMEKAMLKHSGLPGIHRAQVLGFRRLRWRILQSAGGIPDVPLSDQGRNLLLAGLLQAHRDELSIFRKAAEHPGFVERLGRAIKELQEAGLGLPWLQGKSLTFSHTASALELTDYSGQGLEGREQVVEAKAHDLALIWETYQRTLRELDLVDDSHAWAIAIEGVKRASFLEQAQIWIDGFDKFSAPQMGLIAALLRKVKEMSITLRLDSTVNTSEAHGVFAYSDTTLRSLVELGEALSVPYIVDTIFSSTPFRFLECEELAYLEQQLRYPNGHRLPFSDAVHRLSIRPVANQRDEVVQAARFLIGQARDHEIKWRDMAVAVSDINLYGGLLSGIFADYSIPFFLDQSPSIHWHPLMVFLSGALEVVTTDWKTEAVMQVLKSDLTPGGRYDVDRLENYALANGIDGPLWVEPRILEKINEELGEEAKSDGWLMPLVDFYRKTVVAKGEPVLGRELMTSLWFLLEELGIPARLDYWANQEKGMTEPWSLGSEDPLSGASSHISIWNLWVNLVDDFMQSLGNTPLMWEHFASILQRCIDNLRLTRIPQGLDQVLVSTPARLLNTEVDVLVILGADEKRLQMVGGEDTILSDGERLALQAKGWYLEPQGRLHMVREPLLWYSLFTRAKKSLSVSYPLADGDGKALEPSIIIKELQQLFPGLTDEDGDLSLGHAHTLTNKAELPCTISDAATFVAKALRRLKDGMEGEIDKTEQEKVLALYDWLVSQDKGKSALGRCLAGLNYTNQAGPLSSSLVERLYGGTLVTNVHHLEAAAQCPFQFFARAVLRLEERRVLKWDARVEGQLWHEALAELTRYLWKEELDLAELEEAEIEEIAKKIWELAAHKHAPVYAGVLESYHHRIERLGRGFQRVVLVLAEHAYRGQFRPLAVEVSFGIAQGLPAWRISINGTDSVHVRGRVDRIEAAQLDNTLYLRVIDFKRGDRKLRLPDVYQGFALQLLTYLGAVMENGGMWLEGEWGSSDLEIIPAGALYFRLNEPLVKLDGPGEKETLALKLLGEYRASGILLADTDVIELMEEGIHGRSQLLPVGIKGDGGLYQDSSTYSLEELETMLAYVKLRIQTLAESILAGKIEIEPYRKVRARACNYCQYMPICRFELGVSGCRYRYVPDLSDKEALEYMAEAVEQVKGWTRRR